MSFFPFIISWLDLILKCEQCVFYRMISDKIPRLTRISAAEVLYMRISPTVIQWGDSMWNVEHAAYSTWNYYFFFCMWMRYEIPIHLHWLLDICRFDEGVVTESAPKSSWNLECVNMTFLSTVRHVTKQLQLRQFHWKMKDTQPTYIKISRKRSSMLWSRVNWDPKRVGVFPAFESDVNSGTGNHFIIMQ